LDIIIEGLAWWEACESKEAVEEGELEGDKFLPP
jgi:hypothetical protein